MGKTYLAADQNCLTHIFTRLDPRCCSWLQRKNGLTISHHFHHSCFKRANIGRQYPPQHKSISHIHTGGMQVRKRRKKVLYPFRSLRSFRHRKTIIWPFFRSIFGMSCQNKAQGGIRVTMFLNIVSNVELLCKKENASTSCVEPKGTISEALGRK